MQREHLDCIYIFRGCSPCQVIARAEKAWGAAADRRALLPRMAFASGDFFRPGSLPTAEGGGALFIMRQILHDWPDADALRILRSTRQAMGATASTLALVEARYSCLSPHCCTPCMHPAC